MTAIALPVLEVMEQLCTALMSPGAAVLIAPPGTGKTTGVAPVLLGQPWATTGRIILVEPRRIAARAAATRMAELHSQRVGEQFGYAVRGERKLSAQTRVEVLTEGLFLRRLQADPELPGVCAVLLDEFHERSLDSDLLLALLLDLRSSIRPDLRLLVMSATLEASPVATLIGEAPVIQALSKMYPVQTLYRPGSAHDPLEERVAAVVVEALQNDLGDILVFLPGRPEIHRVRRILERIGISASLGSNPGIGTTVVRELHGSLSPAEQEEVIKGNDDSQRRVVLSTSLAETSITVPGVRIVVDAGRRRAMRTDPQSGLPALITTAVSQAGADQRRGRAGRTAPGVAYRLWAENEHRHRSTADTPEILDGDLAPLLLQLLDWGVADPASLRWIDPPEELRVAQGRALLLSLEAIDSEGRLTSHGRELAQIGFHPRLAAVAHAGRSLGAADLAAVVVAVLETARSGEVDLVERARELSAGIGTGEAQHAVTQWRRTLGVDRHKQATSSELLPPDEFEALVGR
ncbi:MAG: helicase-related protein, partial [Microthrixaceae bacterium]